MTVYAPSGTSAGMAVPTKGLASARPAVTKAGQTYFATDTLVLSISTDGATWDAPVGGGSPLTTKGDLFGFDTAGTRIPVGTNGQVLTADSTQTPGLKWATPAAAGAAPLARVAYNPGTPATYTTSSGTTSDVDATNLAITFTDPASNAVVVRFVGVALQSSTTGFQHWTVREGAADIAGTDSQITTLTNGARYSQDFVITSIGAGSHTYKWGFYSEGSVTATLKGGSTVGALVMEIWSA